MTFSSVCADGRMLTVVLDENEAEQSRGFSDVFDSDDTLSLS